MSSSRPKSPTPQPSRSFSGTSTTGESGTGLKPPGPPRSGHQHSHSHSGHSGLPISPGSGNANRQPRASMDSNGGLSTQTNAMLGQQSPGPGGGHFGRNLRPTSELLPGGNNFGTASPETEAIDRWFNDLQHYEATLEEMAAASLDQNFKEELGAIEQWFRVLSEAERTAALYSLLQTSTQVQIRFFITVLQQMARADPMSSLLSPSNTNPGAMEAQLEAKMATMGMKSPSSPALRNLARQSLGAEPTNYLSPHSALYDDNAAVTLANQRAKLKAAQRISAPGTLPGGSFTSEGGLKSPLWAPAGSEQLAAEGSRRSPSPHARPKSAGSDISAGNTANNFLRSPNSAALDEQFSPMPGGSWASMVNTPLVPMFSKLGGDEEGGFAAVPTSPNLDMANQRLQNPAGQGQSGIVLDDARKFRRTGRIVSAGNMGNGSMGNFGGGDQMMMAGGGGGRRMPSNPLVSPNSLLSQQAAVAAQQTWRNGLLSPGTMSNPNAFAGLTPQDVANVNMANLIVQQQQMQQQLQLQQSLLGMGVGMGGAMNLINMQNQGMLSPNMGMSMGSVTSPGGGGGNNRKSPRISDRSPTAGGRSPHVVQPGSGANAEEQVDLNLLNDIPAWLRSLRLHKYTTLFEKSSWKDIVVMDDAALEAKGVSALGARRKLLKVFETVRQQTGMSEPGAATDAVKSPSLSVKSE